MLETARGGILLRGIGVHHNDVAVVTNVSADHLDLHGISTVDQLAEVKATVTKITRPDGWDVLNADDPRVLAMRRGATGRPWLFSLDPRHPALRDALAEGGRAMTVLDGTIVWMERPAVHPVVALERVPVTLAGALADVHAERARGGRRRPRRRPAAAERRQGLRTFVPDPTSNPGRTNLFSLDRRLVVLDYAHNEAGMDGLVEILGLGAWEARSGSRSAPPATGRTRSSTGSRSARPSGVDHLATAEQLPVPTRAAPGGRDRAPAGGGRPRRQARRPGLPRRDARAARMLKASAPGDVTGITALAQRAQAFRWLRSKDARLLDPAQVRRIVRRVRVARASPEPPVSAGGAHAWEDGADGVHHALRDGVRPRGCLQPRSRDLRT